MKKRMLFFAWIMLFGMCACSNQSANVKIESESGIAADELASEAWDETEVDEEVTEMNEKNRTLIADALGVNENSRNIRFILSSLNTVGAGQIQSAEVTEEDGEKVIKVVAEDGIDYQIYLSENGSVEAVKNLTTGEWPVQSER